ncbi:Piwi domain-containing protein [Neohortaea acidophila]|uniref:Piwi domain-containing protein n=1 Tax=Neohortaea acidophila TaxID=245834 RepID=A0A6A6PWU3_9PEZI|nr:Piwi domain-containing protein [Neohortaea acidophila]KAF2483953.1 Piwi domain-containing protein [Neohortaea acidophila]
MASSRERMVLCVRCSDSASAQLSRHDDDFAKCQMEHPLIEFPLDGQTHIDKDGKAPHADKRWWSFKPGPVDTTEIDLTQRSTCIALLTEAKAVFPLTRSNKTPSNAQISGAKTAKEESKFRGISITKDMLETALRIASLPEERGGSDTQAVDPTAGASAPVSSSGNDGLKSGNGNGAPLDKSSILEASSAAPQSASGPSRAVQGSAAPHIAGPSSASPKTATSSTAMPSAEAPTTTSAAPSTEIDDGMSMLHLQSQPETEYAGPSRSATTNVNTQFIGPKRAGSSTLTPSTAAPTHFQPHEGQGTLPAMGTLSLQGENRPTSNPARTARGQVAPPSALPSNSLLNTSTSISRGPGVTPTKQVAGTKGGTESNTSTSGHAALSVDGNEAIRKIDAFIDKRFKESKGSKKEQDIINELALRRTFASGQSKREIVTNYMNISLPAKMYVYKVEMIRAKPTSAPNILVKRFADKNAVIESIARTTGHALNANITKWVTDGDLIWSRDRIFPSSREDGNHQGPILVDSQPRIRYQNECGKVLLVEEVNFYEWNPISCNMSMTELVQLPSPAVPGENDSAVLLRGLNAFLTAYARQRDNITFASGNKGYMMNKPRKLSDCIDVVPGFSLSVRPGVDQLLMCINTAHSPFFKPGLSLQYIIEKSGRGLGILRRALKGVKVRINYSIRAGWSPREDVRFVKKIGKLIAVQACDESQARDAAANALPTVQQLFTKPTQTQRAHPCYPLNPLRLESRSFAVQVATDSRPDSTDTEWYPASVLVVEPNQPWHGDLTGFETSNMIKTAQMNPQDNQSKILNEGLMMLGLDPPMQTELTRQFGMATGTQLIKVDAVWLTTPRIQYRTAKSKSNGVDLQVARFKQESASWNLGNGAKFFACNGMVPNGLPILDLFPNSQMTRQELMDLHKFMDEFRKQMGEALQTLGLNPPKDGSAVKWNTGSNTLTMRGVLDYERVLKDIFERGLAMSPGQTLTVVLKEKDFEVYSRIKRVADLKLGAHTVLCRKRRNFNVQCAANMAMKYNLKRGGTNHALEEGAFADLRHNKVADTIVIGADVTHPGAGASPGTPSIAAVVGSVDNNFTHFPGSMRLQRARKEDIVELGDMVKERLIDWAKKNGDKLPTRMLFYRDGVSESQYEKLRTYELPQIQKGFNWAAEYLAWEANGCRPGMQQTSLGSLTPAMTVQPHPNQSRSLDASRNPWPPATHKKGEDEKFEDNTGRNENFKLTYVVVGKRHNTRFYPREQNNPRDSIQERNGQGNVMPGFVVDSTITHPHSFDFYLQSHCPIQGTGRSAHYFVLRNEMNLSTPQLQDVTNRLCHVYARSTTAVSYCAPAYYADRLCDRGRAYLRPWLTNQNDQASGLYRPAERRQDQTPTQYNDMVKDELRDDPNWRPYHNAAYPGQLNPPMKYGFTRRNPWHANLDDTMFYL